MNKKMNKLKLVFGSTILIICLTGNIFAYNTVYDFFENIINSVGTSFTGGDCPLRSCADCPINNPNCRINSGG